jgi:hypothetical protein
MAASTIIVKFSTRYYKAFFITSVFLGLLLLYSIHWNDIPLPQILEIATQKPVWLVATISPAFGLQRRSIIRATWQHLYSNPSFTFRFVISNPGELWMPVIDQENKTYGDLIMLPHLEENGTIANTIKTIEFFRWLAQRGDTWKYVSKVDDDSFLDAQTFARDWLYPNIEKYSIYNQEQAGKHDGSDVPLRRLTVIGRHLDEEFVYPGGQFYTVNWELMLALQKLYSENPIRDEFEDVLIGRLMHEGQLPFDFITLNNTQAFDYNEGDGNPNAWSHNLSLPAVNPHKMKNDEVYLKVALRYDSNGGFKEIGTISDPTKS